MVYRLSNLLRKRPRKAGGCGRCETAKRKDALISILLI